MSIIRNKPVRKTVIRGDRSFNLETFEVIVISDEVYSGLSYDHYEEKKFYNINNLNNLYGHIILSP